jgi:hypothetical protein
MPIATAPKDDMIVAVMLYSSHLTGLADGVSSRCALT